MREKQRQIKGDRESGSNVGQDERDVMGENTRKRKQELKTEVEMRQKLRQSHSLY